MRIAHCCPQYWGTSETFIRDLVEGWHASGHEVHVLANRLTVTGRDIAKIGIHAHEVMFIPNATVLSRLFWSAAERSLLSDKWGFYPKGRQLATCVLRPRLATLNPDVLYADYGQTGVLLLDVSRALGIPLVVHFHGADASAAMASSAYVSAVRELLGMARAVIVPSEHVRRLLIAQCGDIGRIVVIPYQPHTAIAPSATRTRWPSVVAIGRLTGKKNPLATLEAFRIVIAAVSDARLIMIGDGPLRQRVTDRVRRLGLTDHVRLPGALPHATALDYLRESWVFAQHSVTSVDGDQEGQPVAIMEAMAAEVPPVSTMHAGIPEVVTHNRTGFLVREHDYESMAEHIIALLRSAELRHSMGAAARVSVRAQFSTRNRPELLADVLRKAHPQ